MSELTADQEQALAEIREKAGPVKKAVAKVVGPTLDVEASQAYWTREQLAALASIGLDDRVPDANKLAFLHLAQRTGLDPFARELYLIGRKDKDGKIQWAAQTGIDGFRTLAERTGEYAGKIGPLWCGPDGVWKDVWLDDTAPSAARIGILRHGFPEPLWATAIYREFVPMKDVWENGRKTGAQTPQGLWGKMPAHMIAKCAEALAIRQAFPRQASGLYTDDEMAQADAAAEAAEREETARLRAEQRTAFVRPWGTENASLADVAPGEVVEGVVVDRVLPTREELLIELGEQATVLNTTVTALARRAVAAHRKNVEDFTDLELLSLVESRRPEVAQAVQQVVAEAAEATILPDDVTAAAPGPPAPKRTRKAAERAPTLLDDSGAVNPDAPHPYAGDDHDGCLVCGLAFPVHFHDGPPQ